MRKLFLTRSAVLCLFSIAGVLAGVVGCDLGSKADNSPKDGAAWSNRAVMSVNEKFPVVHGFFNAEPVSATIHSLPTHSWVRIKFKVLVTGTWDGSFLSWGPDLWSLQVRGGQQLMMTSFSSMGARSPNYVQAFPDDYPWGLHYAYTGGVPVEAKPFSEPGSTGMAVSRACYPVEVVFPHTSSDLTLDFGAMFDDAPQEKQQWAIADFECVTSKEPVALDEVELHRLWAELASRESVHANAAMWKFISGGDKAARFIATKADAMEGADASQYQRPEGLRMRRVQKILRIVRAPGTMGWAVS